MQLHFLKIILFSRAVYICAGFQFHVLYSDLVQVLILLIDKLVKLLCVHLVYVMTENITYTDNSKIQKLSLFIFFYL